MTSLDAILKQYEQGQVQNAQPTTSLSSEERLIDGRWQKLMDPGKNGDGTQTGERSPLNEVEDALKLTGNQKDKEISRQYRSKKFYIVKVIDRDNEEDGVKFWRFKWNYKGDGVIDKIIPIFQKRGDISDVKEGRDLTLMLKSVPLPSGKGNYTVVSMVMADDPTPLSTDETLIGEWLENTETHKDVYSQKPVEYLEAISRGETPQWDTDLKKYVYGDSETTTTFGESNDNKTTDPQSNEPQSSDLPF